MKIRRWIGMVVVLLSIALLPIGVFAQCGMPGMSHGGHKSEPGKQGRNESPAPKRKWSKQVRAVLENEERRAELMDAVSQDDELMREMVERIAAVPEWRALMQDRLATLDADPSDVNDSEDETEQVRAKRDETAGHQHHH